MRETTVKFLSKPKIKEPILIEGLPGMGYVGKLAADYLASELHAEKFAELYSPHFPHHILIGSNGVLKPVRNEFYWATAGKKHLIVLTGDAQATSPQGHYKIVEKILEVATKFGVKKLFTLGGSAIGRYPPEKPKVIGVVSHKELLETYRKYGFVVEDGGGPIVGVSGLLLGLGKLRGIKGVCLLGETHGMVVDHRAAKMVLEVLTKMLGIAIDMSSLERRAKETEKIIERFLVEMERRELKERRRTEEESWYIG